MRSTIRSWRYRLPCYTARLAHSVSLYRPPAEQVGFVMEKADWAIRRVGESILKETARQGLGTMRTTVRPAELLDQTVHFGSQYMWLNWAPHMSSANRYAISYFHGKREDGPEMSSHIDAVLTSEPKLSCIIVSNSIVERRLIEWGISAKKVVRIPIGVDTELFFRATPELRSKARARLGFDDKIRVIGSFQKDGQGWGDGMNPKMIKGPDVFLETIARVKDSYNIVVLLTGPARGYIKSGLEKLGVPYHHTYVENYADLVACYHALDLYLIASREEGGPMALMESMASGVPVVSTLVGMAPDLIEQDVSGGLAASEDTDQLASQIALVFDEMDRHERYAQSGLEVVQQTDWSVVAKAHWDKVYEPMAAK